MMQYWYTASEIAELVKKHEISGLPATKRGVTILADKRNWRESDFSRKRKGRGGGFEYHVSLLPDELQDKLNSNKNIDEALIILKKSSESLVEETKSKTKIPVRRRQKVKIQKPDLTQKLTARQQKIMQARSAVLNEINKRIMDPFYKANTQRQAIISFIEDFKYQFKCIESNIMDSNKRLSDDIYNNALIANLNKGSLSRATIYNWLKLQKEDGNNALAPKLSRVKNDTPKWLYDFLSYYATPQKRSMQHAYDLFIENTYKKPLKDALITSADKSALSVPSQKTIPSYDQVRHAFSKLGALDKSKGRMGKLSLKSMMAYKARSTDDLIPGSVYTADGKTFDAEVAHPIHGQPFRAEITSILDVATRKCVGFSVDLSENKFAVRDALRIACQNHGIPAIFYVDNGKGYKNSAFDDELVGFMSRLGITKMHSIPYNSQARGIIERFNATWNRLAKELPSYINRDMDREASQYAHKKIRGDLRLVGNSKLLISWDEFLDRINEHIGWYNAQPHRSLPKATNPNTGKKEHLSPDQYWQSFVINGFEAFNLEKYEADDLFRPYEKRITRRSEVTFNKNSYFNIELEQYHGKYILAGYDIHDASKLWIRQIDNFEGKQVPGRLICVAEFAGNEERYVPHSYEQKAMEGRAKARKRRLQDKIRVVDSELDGFNVIEHKPEDNIIKIDLNNQKKEPLLVKTDEAKAAQNNDNNKKSFKSDAELAQYACQAPDKLTPSQIEILKDCLNWQASRENLRMSGIDIDELKKALRRAA